MSGKGALRIGTGAGFADDRIEPAVALAEAAAVDVLVFECLAERTVAREGLARRDDPGAGFNPYLRARMEAVLPAARRHGIRIVSNMGAANPAGGARAVVGVARGLGLTGVSCAAVSGDDVTDLVRARPDLTLAESGQPVEEVLPRTVSANAYLGAEAVRLGLETGADVVLTGRVADPSLFLAPVAHHFRWSAQDYPLLAQGTAMGHLLECGAQLTGGCFADPTRPEKHVPDLADLGMPVAEIDASGGFSVTKLAGTGGRIDRRTCTEQLFYEVHDPACYLTPDCTLDMTGIVLTEVAPDRVRVTGAAAGPPPDTLKVLVAYEDGFIGEGQVRFAGPGAVERARLAGEVVEARLRRRGLRFDDLHVDLIGLTSLHRDATPPMRAGTCGAAYEVRLRVAGRAASRAAAAALAYEVRAIHVNGPAGAGGGMAFPVREVLALQSIHLPRALVSPAVEVVGATP
jgi:hypothetical protein